MEYAVAESSLAESQMTRNYPPGRGTRLPSPGVLAWLKLAA